jgi:hypothetical protein
VTPYRIFSLIESCPISQHDGVTTGKTGEMGAASQYVAGWLNANPGRWFLVGEVLDTKNSLIGVDSRMLRKFGYDGEIVNNKMYARLPHASGLPLSDFVTRKGPPGRTEAMPMLQRDKFNWSLEELRNAASTAREWLGGSVGYAAA